MPSVFPKWHCEARHNTVDESRIATVDRSALRKRQAAAPRDERTVRRAAAKSISGVTRTQDLFLEGSRMPASSGKQIIESVMGPSEANNSG
jgi:hypothetical protein